jgi:hypothetical protein
MNEAAEAIAMAKNAMPTLTPNGVGVYDSELRRWISSGPEFEKERSQFLDANVATALAFLRQCRRIKTPNLSSYGLKHAAERWGRRNGMKPYITNGELIVAAIYLNFTIKPYPDGGPNVAIAVAVEDVQRLDPECIWSTKYLSKARQGKLLEWRD